MWAQTTANQREILDRILRGVSPYEGCNGERNKIQSVTTTLRWLCRKGMLLELSAGIYAISPLGKRALEDGHYTEAR